MRRLGPCLILVVAAACRERPTTDPHLFTEWSKNLYGAVRAERVSPPVASRLYAYASIGLYAGLAAADTSLPSLDGRFNGIPRLPRAERGERYDPTLTLIATQRVLFDTLFRDALPTTRSSLTRLLDSLRTARLALSIPTDEQNRSDSLGRLTALGIIGWAHGDGFDSTRGMKYKIPVGRGLWVNDSTTTTYTAQSISGISQLVVPGNPSNAVTGGGGSDRGLILDRQKRAGPSTLPASNSAGVTEPFWGTLRPFALDSWDECPAPPAPAYDEKPGTPLYQEAKHVYDVSKALTPEQRTIALYWADNGGETGTPVGHWLSIAGQLVGEQQVSAEQGARALMATSVAMADAFIAAWGYKFKLNVVRPRTFIRRTIDPNWEPAIPTPPFPEYLSGHSTNSMAAAVALGGVLQSKPFVDSTALTIGHKAREFESFRAAAEEAGLSRIYGGIHYQIANLTGRALGQCIGEKVNERLTAGK
jgi:membrane-associated phospholipid phosphatase